MSRRSVLGVVAIVVAGAIGASRGGLAASEDAAKAICEDVLERVTNGDTDGALSGLCNHVLKPPTEQEQAFHVESWSRQIELATEKYGQRIGYEQVKQAEIGQSLRRYVYVLKFERGLMCWEFIFYRPHDQWKVYTWQMSDRSDTLLN